MGEPPSKFNERVTLSPTVVVSESTVAVKTAAEVSSGEATLERKRISNKNALRKVFSRKEVAGLISTGALDPCKEVLGCVSRFNGFSRVVINC